MADDRTGDGLEQPDPFTEALITRGLDAPMPPGLAARVEAVVAPVVTSLRRRWLVVRGLAVALGVAFVFNGAGNVFLGRSIAENLGEPYSPHVWREGGVALAAIGLVLLIAAARPRRLLSPAAIVACPLAAYYGVVGVGEFDDWVNGGVLHTTQGVLGIALAVGLFWARRYVSPPTDERRT